MKSSGSGFTNSEISLATATISHSPKALEDGRLEERFSVVPDRATGSTSPFGIYGRDGAVFQQSLHSPWIFDTVLLNHLSLQLAPAMVDRLIH